jgi:hypothetical protein
MNFFLINIKDVDEVKINFFISLIRTIKNFDILQDFNINFVILNNFFYYFSKYI